MSRPCASYGTYSNCPQCGHAGYGNYSTRNCFGGNSIGGPRNPTGSPHGRFVQCGVRERMRSIYDSRVQSSECTSDSAPVGQPYQELATVVDVHRTSKFQPTSGGDYYGTTDPTRASPYGLAGVYRTKGYRSASPFGYPQLAGLQTQPDTDYDAYGHYSGYYRPPRLHEPYGRPHGTHRWPGDNNTAYCNL